MGPLKGHTYVLVVKNQACLCLDKEMIQDTRGCRKLPSGNLNNTTSNERYIACAIKGAKIDQDFQGGYTTERN